MHPLQACSGPPLFLSQEPPQAFAVPDPPPPLGSKKPRLSAREAASSFGQCAQHQPPSSSWAGDGAGDPAFRGSQLRQGPFQSPLLCAGSLRSSGGDGSVRLQESRRGGGGSWKRQGLLEAPSPAWPLWQGAPPPHAPLLKGLPPPSAGQAPSPQAKTRVLAAARGPARRGGLGSAALSLLLPRPVLLGVGRESGRGGGGGLEPHVAAGGDEVPEALLVREGVAGAAGGAALQVALQGGWDGRFAELPHFAHHLRERRRGARLRGGRGVLGK